MRGFNRVLWLFLNLIFLITFMIDLVEYSHTMNIFFAYLLHILFFFSVYVCVWFYTEVLP